MTSENNNEQLLARAFSCHQHGQLEEAEALYLRLLEVDPEHIDALALLGTLYAQRKEFSLGLPLLKKSLALNPQQPNVLMNLGSALHDLKQYPEALESYNQAIEFAPEFSAAYFNRGNSFMSMRCYQQAVADYECATKLNPQFAMAYNNHAIVLHDLKQYPAALEKYVQAITLSPEEALFHSNRGNTFFAMMQYDQALIEYQLAIDLDPNFSDAYLGRGLIFNERKEFDSAVEMFVRLLEVAPDFPYAMGYLAHTCQHCCIWDELPNLLKLMEDAIHRGEKACQPFPFLTISNSSSAQLQCAQIFVQDQHQPKPPLWTGEIYRNKKIRIVYVSADFYNHATAYLMAELLELHDAGRFEIYAVSLFSDKKDEMQLRLMRAVPHYVDASAMSDFEIAKMIYGWQADLVVDLKGHTRQARFDIFSYRSAPLQVSYLGYPGTSGANYIDYIVADRFVIPPDQAACYSENIIWMPDSYQINDRKRRIAEKVPRRLDLGLPEQGVVFCCFNAHYKITAEVFDVWMRLLKQLPGSVLWLLEDNAVSQRNLCLAAMRLGVDEARILFASRIAHAEHLARYRHADIFLDTSPTNAHTTASDALWAGVPVVTCPGATFASRVSASLLHAVGLSELVVADYAEYERLSLELALHPVKLNALKSKLLNAHETKPLFDSVRFCKHLESAFLRIWQMHQQEQSKVSFFVTD